MAKATKVFDYRKAELPPQLFQIKIKQRKIDDGLQEAADRFLTIEAQDGPIVQNDIISARIDSDKPWLASECTYFRVGRRLFDKALEQELIGHKLGETVSCQLDGNNVDVTILSIKRRVSPKLTDELVQKLDMEDMNTVDDYTEFVKAQLIEEDKEKKQAALCTLVNRQLVANSEFEFDPNEVENLYEEMFNDFQEGTETEEEFENLLLHLYHTKTMDDAKVEMKKQVENQIQIFAIADALVKENGVSWSEADYKEFIQMSANDRMSAEELMEQMSLEDFLNQQKVEYLQNLETEYYDDRFTVEVVE